MAGDSSSNSVISWPALIDQLNNTFNLIRDIFGYALPGGAFLAVGLAYGSFNLYHVQDLLKPYQIPTWMAFIGIVAICYPVGSVMAATAYMPFMILKYVVWMKDRHPNWILWPWYPQSTKAVATPTEGTSQEWLLNHPTEVSEKIVEIRDQQPKLLDTLDRRETLTLLAGSLTTALLGGWYVFYKANWHFHKIIFVAGLITLIQFLTGMPHLRRVAKSTEKYHDATKGIRKKDTEFADALVELIKAAQAAAAALDKKISP